MSKNKKEKTKAEKRAEKRAVKTNIALEKFKTFMKRYWYWPVTLFLLLGGVLVWCYGIGVFDPNVELTYEGPKEIEMYVDSYYKIDVTATNNAQIKYYVEEGSEKLFSVDSLGMVYAKKSGMGRIFIEAGNKRTAVTITSHVNELMWVLQVGDVIKYDDDIKYGLGQYFDFKSIVVHNQSSDTEINDEDGSVQLVDMVVEFMEDENGNLTKDYEIVGPGKARMDLCNSNDIPVCSIEICAYKKLEESQRVYRLDATFYEMNGDIDYSKMEETIKLEVGQESEIKIRGFSLGGNIFFHNSNPGVLNVTQGGKIRAYGSGTSIVSMVSSGGEVFNYRVEIFIPEIPLYKIGDDDVSRDYWLDEYVELDDIFIFYNSERLYEFKPYGSALETVIEDDGTVHFKAVKLTDDKDAYIIAYDKNGIGLFRFNVSIIEKPEEESEYEDGE